MFRPQTDWIADEDGRILVDFVERFAADFAVVCEKLGRRATLPHLKTSKHKHYSEYYDSETAEIVGQWFSKDIENFGYSYERPSS